MENETLIEQCCRLLAEQKKTIAFAESATAGKVAYEFSQTSDSGSVLKGGLVCYDACVKEELLKIPNDLVEEFTPESAEVTRAMALGLKKIMDADIVVAITGLTAPGGSEHPGKPVGTMFYAILYEGNMVERRKVFTGEPREIVALTLEQITKTLLQLIQTDRGETAT